MRATRGGWFALFVILQLLWALYLFLLLPLKGVRIDVLGYIESIILIEVLGQVVPVELQVKQLFLPLGIEASTQLQRERSQNSTENHCR